MESQHEHATPTPDRLCAECGSAIATSWHTHTFRYGTGESATHLNVRLPVRRCDDCDFDYLDYEGERIKHEAVCHHLGVLTPSEILGIRKSHGLSRAAFAKITGIGEASPSSRSAGTLAGAPLGLAHWPRLPRPEAAPESPGGRAGASSDRWRDFAP